MKKWNFKVENGPKEVSEKLNSALGSNDGFVFNTAKDENGAETFRLRKRVHYPDQILHRNRIIVDGKLSESGSEKETLVNITFSQHMVMTLTVYFSFGMGLFAIISGLISGEMMFMAGGLLIALAIVLWIGVQKKFKKDIDQYKKFISELLDFQL